MWYHHVKIKANLHMSCMEHLWWGYPIYCSIDIFLGRFRSESTKQNKRSNHFITLVSIYYLVFSYTMKLKNSVPFPMCCARLLTLGVFIPHSERINLFSFFCLNYIWQRSRIAEHDTVFSSSSNCNILLDECWFHLPF